MNGLQLARKLSASTRTVGELIRSERIKAVRKKGVWDCDLQSVAEFCRNNEQKSSQLKTQYLRLFLEGLSIEQLQKRVRPDFREKGIVGRTDGFVEQVVYADIQGKKKRIGAHHCSAPDSTEKTKEKGKITHA